MFDTIERARAPSPQTPDEIARDSIVHPLLNHKAGLEPAVYPSVTLYLGPPSRLQQLRQGSQKLQDEIRFAEDATGVIGFEVNPLALPQSYLTKARTMNLIWGGLGKQLHTMAKEVGTSVDTARNHRAVLLRSLGATSIPQAVKVAFDYGILKPSPAVSYKELDGTARELEIVQYMGLGGTKEEIAQQLSLSPATVRTHTYNMLKKNQLNNSAQAVMFACLSGQLLAAASR